MKKNIIYLLSFFVGFFTVSDYAAGQVRFTKHNLSVTGPGAVKATTETEICVFCHIPHHEKEGTPLWNRKMPTSTYTLFDSEFIQRINYPSAQPLSEVEGQPGIVSRQCLSCHDGTVAIGAVYILKGTELGNTIIDVQNTNPDGTLPSNRRTYIGTDLSIHHPVAIEYNPNVSKSFDIGVKTSELKNPHPDPPIKLYTYGGKSYVECTSCHDPHKQNKQFLRVDVGNLAQDFNKTCVSCHDKPGWQTSPHNTITNRFYTDSGVNTHFGEGSQVSVADLGCGNCHTPHNRPPYPPSGKPLLRKPEEQTCFKGASGQSNLAPCHGTGGAKDIESLLPPNKTYGHPVTDITMANIHTPLDVLFGSGVTRVPAGSYGIEFSDSKHAECMDCHNPHKAMAGTRTPPGQWYPNTITANSNNVSNVLLGVSGVEPIWGGMWTQPSQFQTLAEATKEYQICMKCHSKWALGDSPNLDCRTQWTSSQSGIILTDQSCEFSPNNKSAHPVVMPLNQMTGNYAPKALTQSQLKPPWNQNPGNQTMYCTDCHGTDDETIDPKGPHGSTHQFMLKGPNKYWPMKPTGGYYTVAGDVSWNTNDVNDGLFCRNCHNLYVNVPGEANTHNLFMGSMAGPCVYCHIAIPHGSPVSNLIGYRNFPEPYNFRDPITGELMLKLDGYKKMFGDYFSVSARKAYSTDPSCVSSNRPGTCHSINDGGYDFNPYP